VRQCAALEETKVGQVVLVQSRDAAERDAAEILDAAGERLRACNADAARFAELSADAGRIEQLDERIVEAVAHEQRRRDELDGTPDVQVDGSVDVENVRAPLDRAERELERLGVAEGRLRGERDTAERDVARAAQLDAEVQSACAERDDWGKLGDDLGRDGLQAMEIDAAVPEINTLANDLLHTCHGSRFTIEVRTDRSSADGKRTLEGLDVRVLDTVGGRDDLAETYSGGECVIVGEALALALTVVACRRRGVTAPTLVRDESGAALDAENGRAYVAMLRRAAEAVGAACTLVVSHDAGVRELCDARIEIAAGRIEVKA
jgi:exonuclease SbcC